MGVDILDRLVTADGVSLEARAWYAGGEPRAAVVLSHGFSAHTADPQVITVAEMLQARGLDVISYDARGHGRSGGQSTLGDLEAHDVAAAAAVASRRSERVLLVGASMGAIAVLRHAAGIGAGVDGVVLVSCPSRWALPRNHRALLAAGITRTRIGRLVASRYLGVTVCPRWTNPEPPTELMGRVSVPVAVVHGDDDRFIPASASRELLDASSGGARLWQVPGMGHAFDARSIEPIGEAVDWALDSARTGAPGAPIAAAS
ncbi:MAG: alpha/beta fold hydrolase [Acidimicrobiia bacterium]|nr:alpha/beta fold hydrolase [Acidimicrobiia bacterium]